MILADTNVVSEFVKERPDSRVLAWAQALDANELTISVITVEEIERGLGRLPAGRRQSSLAQRWHRLVDTFADTLAVYDLPAARATARILAHAEADGHPMGLADAQIAGICLSDGCQLATRNVPDFAGVPDLIVVNPFE